MFEIGVTPPFYRDPVETMAFNLYAMDISRKDELRDLAYYIAISPNLPSGTINLNLTQNEWQYVQDEIAKIRGGI